MIELFGRIAACIASCCFFYIATFKSLGALQQCGYKNSGFTRWLRRKDNLFFNRLALWSGLMLLSCGVVSLTFSFAGAKIALLLSALPFFGFCLLYCIADRKYALKVSVKKTARFKRISAVYILLTACLSYFVIALCGFVAQVVDKELYTFFSYLPFACMPLTLPWILCLSNALDSLYETPHNKKFVKRAGQVLDETNMIRVAVAGSYGKTSVKNILKSILSAKYSVVATPESFNTPVGIARTVTGGDFAGKQVFLAETGARRIGDIEELCALIKPDFAVFTGVCAQHIASFGSEENVLKAKSEIIKGTKKTVVCGGALREKIAALPLETLTLSDKEKCVYADFGTLVTDLRLLAKETSFTLRLPGESPIPVKTTLLGRQAAENIALAALLAHEMGLSAAEIQAGIADVQTVPHRLQLIESGGAYILDDSYNSNPLGAEEAIDALLRFGGRKIVVTPGLVECGILEEALNAKLGKKLAGLDEVILVGDTLVGALKAGYLAAGGDKDKIFVFPTLDQASARVGEILGKGDCVLFLNDLPDAW